MTVTLAPPTPRTRSFPLVATPSVVAHRGASGYRPEHTLAAYRLALDLGADAIELDLVTTRDGVLVARHDVELSRTTDVATRAELADRRTTRSVDGRLLTGWFVEDLLLEEVQSLTVRERFPLARPQSAAHERAGHGVATFDEILHLVRGESRRRGRAVGVLVELKHAAYFEAAGVALEEPLLAALERHGLDHPRSGVSVMSFETTVLRRLARSTRVPLVQLLDRGHLRPADLAAAGDPRTYADLVTPNGLAGIERYADGVGPHKALVLESTLVRDAHRQWLTVHAWTLRAENRFLAPAFRTGPDPDAHGDLAGEARLLLDLGVDGLITDHPDTVVAARAGAPVHLAG